jgi:thioredoxin-like negative regulator of GroEL
VTALSPCLIASWRSVCTVTSRVLSPVNAFAAEQGQRGKHADAESLAREAVSILASTDALNNQGDALCDLAEVLAAASRTEEAADALEQALDRYGRKKNLAMVAQVCLRLEALQAGSRA